MEQAITEGVQYRILVVDDEPDTARLAREWLDSGSFQILEAADGERGLDIATRENPDVILLDLKMPGIDGIEVARQLKDDPRTRAIPIMVLSACRDLDAKVKAFRAGADDYLAKPFAFQEVYLRIEGLLRTREKLVSMESTIKNLSSKNEHLEERLMVDDKTGLYNFRAFQRKLADEWQRARRYNVPLSLVFLDIDQFKHVNDTLGHPAGDRVLEEFSTLVTGGARANDVAARYGGEEFAVVLPHTDAEMAVRVAERIRAAVEEFVFLEKDTPTQITVSAGVATMPTTPGVDSMDALVRAADAALYSAKDLGRNRVVEAGTE